MCSQRHGNSFMCGNAVKNPLRKTPHTPPLQRRMEIGPSISAAISTGVPLFNGGDHAGCSAIYRDVAIKILEKAPGLNEQSRKILVRALQEATSGLPTKDAWTMRHALDDVMRLAANDGRVGGLDDGSRTVIDFADHSLKWLVVDDRVSEFATLSQTVPTMIAAS